MQVLAGNGGCVMSSRKSWEEAKARQAELIKGNPRETGADLRARRIREYHEKLKHAGETRVISSDDFTLITKGGAKYVGK